MDHAQMLPAIASLDGHVFFLKADMPMINPHSNTVVRYLG